MPSTDNLNEQGGPATARNAEPILDAFRLNHGEGHGRSFPSLVFRARVLEAFRKNCELSNLSDLERTLERVHYVPPSRQTTECEDPSGIIVRCPCEGCYPPEG